jgi:hypothetical protein
MEKLLEASKTQSLRETGIIKQSEIVKIVGDVCVAEDVVTGERRLLPNVTEHSIGSTSRRVLRD